MKRNSYTSELQQSEANFRTFFNSIGDLLFVLDNQGNILMANESAIIGLEYSETELRG
jgi:PAS domain S-box-containing protein